MSKILVIDNYDSFVFNLVQYLAQLGAEVEVRRNDRVAVDDRLVEEADGILLSPGPGKPEDAGVCVDLIKAVAEATPILGVCLGHQAIAVAYGGTVDRAPELLHGKTSEVEHDGAGVLAGLPQPFTATRYHSLAAVEPDLPAPLEITARTAGGVIMGLRHRELPVEGVQFHPESVLTQGGHQMLANWLRMCGDPSAEALVPQLAERVERQRVSVS
jgi:para-aminobenzoate synthetase component 2